MAPVVETLIYPKKQNQWTGVMAAAKTTMMQQNYVKSILQDLTYVELTFNFKKTIIK